MFLNVGRAGETSADVFLLLQRPVDDDGIDEFLSFDGERLGLKIAVATGPDVSQLGRRFTSSDVIEHGVAL